MTYKIQIIVNNNNRYVFNIGIQFNKEIVSEKTVVCRPWVLDRKLEFRIYFISCMIKLVLIKSI